MLAANSTIPNCISIPAISNSSKDRFHLNPRVVLELARLTVVIFNHRGCVPLVKAKRGCGVPDFSNLCEWQIQKRI